MKILTNTNELLRAAESYMTNEERLSAYEAKKRVREAQNRLQRAYDDYVDKRIPPDAGEPDNFYYGEDI